MWCGRETTDRFGTSLHRRNMKKLLIAGLMLLPLTVKAQSLDLHTYPTTSWTYNVDFKDTDAIGPFIGRDIVEGQYKGGVYWTPMSVYHINDAQGTASRWFTLGVFLITNAEKLNATFGPTLGRSD